MEFDCIIRNGQVVDGSGNRPPFRADVGLKGDRIAAVGDLSAATAASEIDATGRLVCPGFVDVHIHSEIELLGGPRAHGALLQGVTTQLLAPDGFGWAQLSPDKARQMWQMTLFAHGNANLSLNWPKPEDYLAEFAGRTPANVVPQVPHCAVRLAVMGWDPRPATDAEILAMKDLVREWMEAGAVALNLGLDYQPSAYADLRELVELSRVAAEYGGIYAAHIRYGDYGRTEAWRETMQISRQAQIPVHISHEMVGDETAAVLEEAANDDLSFESYMYRAGCTHLAMMLPTWAQAGGPEGIMQRLKNPTSREKMRVHLQQHLGDRLASGARPVFAETQSGRYIGLQLDEAAALEKESIGDFAIRTLEEESPYALMVFHRPVTDEEQNQVVERTIKHPRMMVASDGIYHGRHTHPRGYGCFARIFRLCVRELGAVSLETAVHKMTGYPAARFRLKDRGQIQPGFGADLVILDAERVADRSTWDEPWLEPVGIDRVMVNGRTVVQNGKPTKELPGRVLRRS